MKLQGKTAIVTGASRGIGREIAKAIAANGGRVGLVGRSVEGLKETQKSILGSGGEAKIFPTDLRDERAINKLASDVKEVWGDIDILVNVAGVWHNGNIMYYGPHLEDTPAEQVNEVLDVGIRAPMLLTRLLIPGMIRKKRGKILQISGGFAGAKDAIGWPHYYVSKKAIEHFTEGLAEELREHEIQVNCISPWFVATEPVYKFFPEEAEKALDPVEVAKFAIFLLSEDADHITGAVIILRNKSDH